MKKTLFAALTLCATLLTTVGCNSSTGGLTPGNSISFTNADGSKWQSLATIETKSGDTSVITASSSNADVFVLAYLNVKKTGTYYFDTPDSGLVIATYRVKSSSKTYAALPLLSTINITTLTSSAFSATFSGLFSNTASPLDTIRISNGSVTVD